MIDETEFDDADGARLRRAEERIYKLIGSSCPFTRGVKLITREKRLERAMKWFQHFIISRSPEVETAEREIAELRKKGFATHQVVLLRDKFATWKAKEKSRKAKESRAARGKRGRVKSKKDKRLGARYKGKRILPIKKS